LIQYGGKIEPNKLACRKYRAHPDVSRFYTYDKEYADNLALIIGIDFSEEMLTSALQWIHENNLDELYFKDRIIMIRGIAQYLNLSFKSTPYEDSYKVVTCVFQTLGNQLDRRLQIKMLQKMKEFVEPHGTIFVSVFNKNAFMEYLPKYYKKIEPSIGPIVSSRENHEKAILKTKWGVYSRWFNEEELKELFLEASKIPFYKELSNVQIKSGDALPLFPDDTDYLSMEEQKSVRKRAIIATLDV
jgi:ubiquinone/menaquinone biosynthesis C-methylase UbiE